MGKQSCVHNGSIEDVRELPPSAKLVFKTLQYQDEMTQIELADETRLATRTVRYATNRLANAGVVSSRINIRDARQQIYTLTPKFQLDDGDKDQ
jgi:DNA-binding MarR family transcriptional regulator